jgi:hypothetical protein
MVAVVTEVDDLGVVDLVESVPDLELCRGQQEERNQSEHQILLDLLALIRLVRLSISLLFDS